MPPLKAPKSASQFYALGSLAIVLALLYFGQEVLIPLALAVLIAFLLAPVVGWLERLRLGRVPSTLLVVVVALALVGGFGWIVEQRFVEIVNRLPEYRQSVQTKLQRFTRSGGMVEKVRAELRQVQDATTQATTQTTVPATQPFATGAGVPVVIAAAPPAASDRPLAGNAPPALVRPSPDDPWAVRLYPKPESALELVG